MLMVGEARDQSEQSSGCAFYGAIGSFLQMFAHTHNLCLPSRQTRGITRAQGPIPVRQGGPGRCVWSGEGPTVQRGVHLPPNPEVPLYDMHSLSPAHLFLFLVKLRRLKPITLQGAQFHSEWYHFSLLNPCRHDP